MKKLFNLGNKSNIVDDKDHLSFPNFLTHWQIQAVIICILLFLSYLSILYGYSKSLYMEGPTLGIGNERGRLQHAMEKRFQTLVKGNASLCQNLVLESNFQAQEYLTPFLLKNDKENSCE